MKSTWAKLRQQVHLGIILMILLAGCLPLNLESPRATRSIGRAELRQVDIVKAASAQATFEGFLQDWAAEDYPAMYDRLSSLSSDAISLEEFSDTYQNIANTLTLQAVNSSVLSVLADDLQAEIAYRVNYETQLVGTLSRDAVASLVYELDGWRIQWENALIFPDLHDGSRLDFVHQIPSRGRIFDRSGAPMAAYESAIAIGLVPGEILPEQADQLYGILAEISFYDPESLARLVESTPADWYLPVVTLTRDAAAPHIDGLRALNGVRINEFRSRFYVDGGVAPHALGYMLFIPEEQLDDYLRLGYRQDERIGVSGLEAAFEAELSGQRGGALYLMSPGGGVRSLLAASDPVGGQSITTTLDKNLQMQLQASLGDLRAAVVVMEVDTGRVLALVSNPHFDPNAFDETEPDRSLLESYFTNPDQPLFNRATQGQYPLGSVFKVISMAAALESGTYQAGSTLYCGHSMWVCNSVTLYDWTLGFGVGPSGTLNLMEGLMRSCNPWYYRIGEALFTGGMDGYLSEMAFGFGLGDKTGIDIPEAGGNIPPMADTCLNSAQIAIGQGEVLVTPLQVAAYFAAVANGGTLYRPALVESIRPGTGEPSYVFSSESLGQLPISDENLAAIAGALRMVVEEPRGTAYWAMDGLLVPVSGKTGTAETPTGRSHAWFAGYSQARDPERPDIAVAVIVENSGEGSVMAAPVFRRAVSLYFSDGEDPGGVMPWESEPFMPLQPEDELDE